MNGLIQYKDLASGAVSDVDIKRRRVSGYLSKFGNIDLDGDAIMPGAFKRSIGMRRDKLRFLNQHEWKQPHGRFEEIKEDSNGLYFVSTPFIDTTYSSDALKLYDAGIITEHSIGFKLLNGQRKTSSDGQPFQEITEVLLYEGSNVTLGANPEAQFMGFKSATLEEQEDHIKKILKVFQNGTLSDDGFNALEIALKQLQRQAYELGTIARKDTTGPPATAPSDDFAPLLSIIDNYR